MRKRIIGREVEQPQEQYHWLNLVQLAQAEITSEDAEHPFEAALIDSSCGGWRAAESGQQTLRLLFDSAQNIGLIRLVFEVPEQPRTQEFVLRFSSDGGVSYRDIARQQYNFSAPDATRQIEEYSVNLEAVSGLELCIVPEIGGGSVHATLAEWRVA